MNHQLPRLTLERLKRVFADYPDLAEVRLFGSFATGKATPRSDIDLATVGISDRYRLGRLVMDLEDLPIPQKCEVQAYERISYEPLRRQIDAWGVTIYRKGEDGGRAPPAGRVDARMGRAGGNYAGRGEYAAGV